MTISQALPELAGKTIVSAVIQPNVGGNDELHIALSDGSTLIVSAWQARDYPLEMSAEIKPATPTA